MSHVTFESPRNYQNLLGISSAPVTLSFSNFIIAAATSLQVTGDASVAGRARELGRIAALRSLRISALLEDFGIHHQ